MDMKEKVAELKQIITREGVPKDILERIRQGQRADICTPFCEQTILKKKLCKECESNRGCKLFTRSLEMLAHGSHLCEEMPACRSEIVEATVQVIMETIQASEEGIKHANRKFAASL